MKCSASYRRGWRD